MSRETAPASSPRSLPGRSARRANAGASLYAEAEKFIPRTRYVDNRGGDSVCIFILNSKHSQPCIGGQKCRDLFDLVERAKIGGRHGEIPPSAFSDDYGENSEA